MAQFQQLLDGKVPFRPVGIHTQVADISSATTIPVVAGAKILLLQALTKSIRFTLDGTAPAADKGFELPAGEGILLEVCDGMTVKVIETSASGSIEYQWSQ
jgi:hypothetical protein